MQLNQVKERIQEANGNRSRAPFQGARSLITLRSIESRERSFAARAYAGAPSLRCSSLVAPMLRPSSLGDSLPSISLHIVATTQWWVKLCIRVRSRAVLQTARSLITDRLRVSVRHLSPLRCSPLRKEPPRPALRYPSILHNYGW